MFSKASRPRRPGAYVNYEVEQAAQIPTATGAIVAIPITHSWGPFKIATLCRSWDEFRSIFGDFDSPGRRAVYQAFKGEGLPGARGAGAVLVYRFGAAAAAKASKALQNTTPVAALTLTAKYEGTKGNALNVTVQASSVAGNTDLLIYDGTVLLESYTFPSVNLANAAAQINQLSRWVTALVTQDGVGLASIANTPLTAGNDGSTPLAIDWTAAMSALEVERFGVFSPFDLTDGAVLASLVTWAKNLNGAGRRFLTVVGGAIGEAVSAAITRSGTINDPNFINVGGGSVIDDDLGRTLSTSELAPRIAGIVAARGEAASLTMARLAGLTGIIAGATSAQIDQAFDAGVVVVARDSYEAAPVRIEKGLTTYTTKSDPARPYGVFSNPKFVFTMAGIENDVVSLGAAPGIIGVLPVNDKTRNFVKGDVAALLQRRQEQGVIQPGWSADVDQDPPPSDDDEFIALRLGLRFSRSTEQVFITVAAG